MRSASPPWARRCGAPSTGDYATERAAARDAFPSDNMLMDPGLDVDASRDWTLHRLLTFRTRASAPRECLNGAGAPADPLHAVVTFEMLSHGDMSVTIKSGVQFGLFGGAVTNLGTAWHHDTFLPGHHLDGDPRRLRHDGAGPRL